jgi:hypothetical protein
MRRFDRLLVLWVSPTDGSRHVIGHLWREQGEYFFDFDPGAASAMSAGFNVPTEFRDSAEVPDRVERPFRARHLFPVFSQRIPHPQRADHDAMLASWGVEDRDDMFEILARSGGIQMTDRLELAEYRPPDDPLTTPLEFRVARPTRALAVGEPIGVRRDRGNAYDTFAVHVVDSTGSAVGFVPRHYSEIVACLLDAGATLSGEIIRQLTVPEGKWVARLQRGPDLAGTARTPT